MIQARLGKSIQTVRPLRNAARRLDLRLTERRQAVITAAVTGQIDVTTAGGVDV
jgi:type I restriction enzyme S subunit